MKVGVIGASGFVGSRVCAALESAQHDVVAFTRQPEDHAGAGRPERLDLDDASSVQKAIQGLNALYFLSHSLGSEGFADREKEHAKAVQKAAAEAQLGQIVFLAGLGRDDDDLSPHLRSRREVEATLAGGTVPVTVLRAGILIGSGSTSWEILRQGINALPIMVTDSRARTKHQPIAADDAVSYLRDVLGRQECVGQTFEIGGPDVLSYQDMIGRLATLTNRSRPVIEVPWLPDAVAAAGVGLLTSVDGNLARDLFESMANEAVVTDDRIRSILPRQLLSFDQAARQALGEAVA